MSDYEIQNTPAGSAAGEMPVFNPDQVARLAEQINGYLKGYGYGEAFESRTTFTEDELLGVISLYALAAKHEKEHEERQLITKEALIPILCIKNVEHAGADYTKIANRLNEIHKQQFIERVGDKPYRGLLSKSYGVFLGKIGRTLGSDFQHDRFLKKIPAVVAKKTSNEEVKPKAPPRSRRDLAAPHLEPLPENAPPHLRITHAIIKSADLDVNEALGLLMLLSPRNHGRPMAYEISAAQQIKEAKLALTDVPMPKMLEMSDVETLYVDKFLGKDKPRTVTSLLNEALLAGIASTTVQKHVYSGLTKLARQLEFVKLSHPEKPANPS